MGITAKRRLTIMSMTISLLCSLLVALVAIFAPHQMSFWQALRIDAFAAAGVISGRIYLIRTARRP